MFPFFKKKQAPADVPEIIPIQEEGGVCIAKCWTGKEDADKITNLAFVLFCMELDMVNSIA